MRGVRTAALALALAACSGPSVAPNAPAKGDRRFDAYRLLDVRDAALNAHDLDVAARAYAVNAEVVDAATGQVVLRGRDEIRAAHARFVEACPRGRIEVVDRAYDEGGRFVTDRERVRCRPGATRESLVKYEIEEGTIVRVWHVGSPAFAP